MYYILCWKSVLSNSYILVKDNIVLFDVRQNENNSSELELDTISPNNSFNNTNLLNETINNFDSHEFQKVIFFICLIFFLK